MMFLSSALVFASALLPLAQLQPAASQSAAPKAQRALLELYHVAGNVTDDRLGYALALLEDLDGDGTPEILVGLPNRDPHYAQKGHAWVVSGATGAVLRVHDGTNGGDRFGRAVAMYPDLDHDGVAEYAVGATWALDPPNGNGASYPGTATIFSGATGAQYMVLAGYVANECFGGGLAGLNDVNGDGQGDFVVGSRYGGNIGGIEVTAPGKVRTFSGLTNQVIGEISGSFPGDFLAGEATIAMGDLDADGAIDVASGAWGYPNNTAKGQVFLISTAKNAVLRTMEGEAAGDHFGWSLAMLPDVDGDSVPDVMVGAPWWGVDDRGRAYIYSSATGALLRTFTGSNPNEHLGYSVGSVGDQDGDGVADWAVGAPFYFSETGRAVIISGATDAVLANVSGSATGERFGYAFLEVPDLNADGKPEIAIGATGWPAGQSMGRMTVFATH